MDVCVVERRGWSLGLRQDLEDIVAPCVMERLFPSVIELDAVRSLMSPWSSRTWLSAGSVADSS